MLFLRSLVQHHQPKPIQPKRRYSTKPDRQRFLRPQRPREATSREDHTRQQCKLRSIGLTVLNSVSAESVEGSDCAACCEGWNGARADVACDATAGGEGGEDEGDLTGDGEVR